VGVVTSNGRAIEVVWFAQATSRPTIVFLHEGLGSALQWREFPGDLAALTGCGAVAISRRGYGASDPLPAPWPASFLHDEAALLPEDLAAAGVELPQASASNENILGPQTAPILFGHSDGGSIALIAAAQGLLPVCALILEAAHVFVEQRTVAGITAARDWYASGLRQRLAKWHGEKTDATFAAWTSVWLSAGFGRISLLPLLPAISVPTLVMQGGQDEYGTLAQVDAIANAVVGPTETLVLPDCGHAPHRDQRKAVLEAVQGFLGRHVLTASLKSS